MTNAKMSSARIFLGKRKASSLEAVVDLLKSIEVNEKIGQADKGRSQRQISEALCLGLYNPDQFRRWLSEFCTDQVIDGKVVPAKLKREKKNGVWIYRLKEYNPFGYPTR